MRMATEYDMLSFVGSEIDEINMDHLSFLQLSFQGSNRQRQEIHKYLERDPRTYGVLSQVVQPLGAQILGMGVNISKVTQMRTLAFLNQTIDKLKLLASEATL